MQQHPVPQNIKEFNFKLFGNLTVRQFVTLAIPLSAAAFVFFSSLSTVIRIPVSVVIGLFGFFVALVPVGGRPFDKWIVAFVKAIFAPTQRVWIKEKEIPEFLNVVVRPPAVEEKVPEEVAVKSRERMIAYLKSISRETGSPLDIKEKMQIAALDMSVGTTMEGKLPAPIIWPSPARVEEEKPAILVGEVGQQGKVVEQAVEIEKEIDRLEEQATGKYQETEIKPEEQKPVVLPHITPAARPYTVSGIEEKLRNKVKANYFRKQPASHLASDTNLSENFITVKDENNRIRVMRGVGSTRVRKLHFAPPENFDLSKLPIRGERRFEISDELAKRFHFEQDSPNVVLPNEASATVASVKINIPQSEQAISNSLPKQAKVVGKSSATSIKKAEPIKVEAETKKESSKFSMSNIKQTDAGSNVAQSVQIIPLTSMPNVLSGLVTDINGTPIEAAVLVVRDNNGIPVRALKTNKLGQFLSATPLANGTYTIEVESEQVKFSPTAVSLQGEILPPLGIRGEALK